MKNLQNFFSQEEIENAKKYKYNGKDDSICAKLFLRSYWDFLIKYIPLSFAPNLITLIGFLFEVLSFFISFIISKGSTVPLPGWACIMNGLCLHIYQTLDNLDGRQARRTQNSSPLGQFFDHGCDALTGVFELMKVIMSFNMGNGIESYVFVMLMAIGFYFTSWEEYNRHAFYLGYINGPDEGLLFLTIAQILVGIFPSMQQIPQNIVIQILFVICASSTIIPIIYNVVKDSLNDWNKIKKAIISVLPSLITIAISVVSLFSETNPTSIPYFIIASSLVLQYQSQTTIVAFLTQRPPLRLFDFIIGGIWVFMITPVIIPSLNDGNLYWAFVTVIVIGIMIYFDLGTIFSLSKGLNIPILTIKPREEEKLTIEPQEEIEEEEDKENDKTFHESEENIETLNASNENNATFRESNENV